MVGQNMTQEALAEKTGLTRGYINMFLNAKRGASITQLEAFASALGVQPHELVKPPELELKAV